MDAFKRRSRLLRFALGASIVLFLPVNILQIASYTVWANVESPYFRQLGPCLAQLSPARKGLLEKIPDSPVIDWAKTDVQTRVAINYVTARDDTLKVFVPTFNPRGIYTFTISVTSSVQLSRGWFFAEALLKLSLVVITIVLFRGSNSEPALYLGLVCIGSSLGVFDHPAILSGVGRIVAQMIVDLGMLTTSLASILLSAHVAKASPRYSCQWSALLLAYLLTGLGMLHIVARCLQFELTGCLYPDVLGLLPTLGTQLTFWAFMSTLLIIALGIPHLRGRARVVASLLIAAALLSQVYTILVDWPALFPGITSPLSPSARISDLTYFGYFVVPVLYPVLLHANRTLRIIWGSLPKIIAGDIIAIVATLAFEVVHHLIEVMFSGQQNGLTAADFVIAFAVGLFLKTLIGAADDVITRFKESGRTS